jgi:hypothetical protein
MSINNLNTFLNVKDSHLRVVSGNVYATAMNIGGINVDVAHGLQSVTNQGNVTATTLQFDNATTAFTTTANVTVGRDLTVTGNALVSSNLTVTGNAVISDDLTVTENLLVSNNLTVTGNTFYTNPAAVLVDSNVVTEYTGPHDRPLRKYPEVAIINGTLGPTGGIVQTPGVSESQKGYTVTSSSSWGNGGTDTRAGWCAFDEGKSTTTYKIWQSGNYYTTATPGLYNRSPAQSHTADGVNYEGEWIKLELPRKINISAIEINAAAYSSLTGHVGGRPYEGAILGSNDDSTWSLLKSFSGGLSWATTTVAEGGGRVTLTPDTNTTNKYRYIMLVVNKIQGSRSSVDINEIKYYGHEEGSGSLDTTLKSVYNVPATTGTQLEVYYDGRDYTQTSDFTGTGGVVDKAGGDQDGTAGTGVSFDSTYKAFVFDGTANGNITSSVLPSDFIGDIQHTVSLWFKIDSSSTVTNPCLFDVHKPGAAVGHQRIDIRLQTGSSYQFHYDFWNNYTRWKSPFGSDLPKDEWIHVTATYSGGLGSGPRNVYMNGRLCELVSQATVVNTTPLAVQAGSILLLGKRPDDTSLFDGSIANFRLYSKALNAGQVQELYEYQKDYFLGSKSQVTLYKGHLGVGVTEPSGQLELAGDERLQEYPPGPMDGYETLIPGHGVFCAYASSGYTNGSTQNRFAYNAFDKASGSGGLNDIWQSVDGLYNGGSGTNQPYTGSVRLAENLPKGHYLGLKMPYPVKITSFVMGAYFNSGYRAVGDGLIVGRNTNNPTWEVVHTLTNSFMAGVNGFNIATNAPAILITTPSIPIDNTKYYDEYALVVTGTLGSPLVTVSEWRLFGTPGPTTLDKGSLSLTRSLDVPRVSRYDVDTETPRPEKLVVDFDTTVNSSPTDISGEGNHGTFYGATYSPADKAFNFDGTDDYIKLDTGLTGNVVHSISMWVKAVADFDTGNIDVVLYWGAGGSGSHRVEVYMADDIISYNFASNDYNVTLPTNTLVNDRWYHLVFTYNGVGGASGREVYIDGVKQTGSHTGSTDVLTLANSDLYLASNFSPGGQYHFGGQISNFKLYNVALEPSEVQKLYRLGRTGRSMVISDTAVGIGKVPEAQLDVRGVANFGSRVGIGTTNPGKMLDVNGTTRSRKSAGWKSGTFNSTGVNMGPMADGTTDGPQIGWEYHVTFSAATAGSRVEIYGAYKHSGPLYAASEKWTFRFKEGFGTPDYSNYAELVNDAEPNADTYYAVIRVVNSIYNNTNVVAARHHFMSHTVGCHRSIGATIWQAQGYIDMGGESSDDRFNYLRITSSSGNIKGQWTAFPITT